MTDRVSKPSFAQEKVPQAVSTHSTREAVALGVNYLFSRRQNDHWVDSGAPTGESDAWVTAYVLARLGELPDGYLDHCQLQQIRLSLNWLENKRTPHAGWGYNSRWEDDADSTSWATIALAQQGRIVADSALAWIRTCRRSDGGFAAYPEDSAAGALCPTAAADITAIAVRALRAVDSAAEEFLRSCVCRDLEGSACRMVSGLFLASIILDWERGLASHSLLKDVCDLVDRRGAPCGTFERALLLRCCLRLRMQKAWSVAADLRREQLIDGSWPASAPLRPAISVVHGREDISHRDEKRIVTTATAISALVMAESQPGLYFGSDQPLVRRLKEY